jgi:hypothetical protein
MVVEHPGLLIKNKERKKFVSFISGRCHERFHSIYLMTSHEEKPFIIPFTLIGPNGQKFVQLKLPR